MGDPESLYQTLFDVEVALCDRFPSLSPISIRQAPMREFCLLASRLIDHQRREKKAKKYENWRPAGDSWF